MRVLALLAVLAIPFAAQSEMQTRTTNGVEDKRLNSIVLTNGTIYLNSAQVETSQNLLIKDGVVEGVSPELPVGYRVVDLKGAYVYPGFIDIFSHYGMPGVTSGASSRWSGPETLQTTNQSATNANEAIKSHLSALDFFRPNAGEAEAYRAKGFTTVITAQPDGIARGTAAALLTSEDSVNELVLKDAVATHYSFDKGSSKQFYPISRMGVVSLLRQTEFDARWYGAQSPRPFTDLSLEAWLKHAELPRVMAAFDWKTALLSDRVGDELGYQFIIRAGGDSYQQLPALKATGATLIVDVNFPKAPAVADPVLADYVSLSQLKHWELAPYNLARVEAADIPFVITAKDSGKDFLPNLRTAVANGLSDQATLRALTETPAQLMGIDDQVGSLRQGQLANFVISDGPIFAKGSEVLSTWVRGKEFKQAAPANLEPGPYALSFGGATSEVEISRKTKGYEAKLLEGEGKVKLDVADDYLSLVLTRDGRAASAALWLLGDGWHGNGTGFDGTAVDVALIPTGSSIEQKEEQPEKLEAPGEVIYPFAAHGSTNLPQQENLLIKGATVWTNEAQGILENADVLIRDGKIVAAKPGLKSANARVIDGTGLHVTPGIIDEHSHIALDSVNEFATNSSMVRMVDVVDSEDIGIYRALAGGVTAAQLLHGSANPIGGQSALIKMRWGKTPEGLLIEDADPFIKFALGENVKRSSNTQSVRYPQTRMGVEQVYVNAFNEARLYQQAWNEYNRLPKRQRTKTVMPRRDLRMDAMVEILNGERFVTSHSYVQSEINMLMKVAEQFDFRINTFTHILEGYKVADKMAAHGVGGSTFSDWWTYKWEVRYAIPYNAALMHQAGVTTAINSDDAEMLRRLNQEAAKSIRHGGMSEQDALKMVTLNPAKLLHLDDRMGSIKKGKDADVVIWDGHPLSVYSKPLTTIVDGTVYFDRERDAELQASIEAERHRLIQKILNDGEGSAADGAAPPDPEKLNYSHEVLHQAWEQLSGQHGEMDHD